MDGILTTWWAWMSAALVFGILEVLVPAWIFLGFAAGAGVMGILLAFGILPITSIGALVGFAVASAMAYVGLRFAVGTPRGEVKIITRDINDN